METELTIGILQVKNFVLFSFVSRMQRASRNVKNDANTTNIIEIQYIYLPIQEMY